MEKFLFRMGIASWVTDIITPLPTNPSASFQIGKTLPTNVGLIYGMSTFADGLDPEGSTLISTTQAQGLYFTFQDGPTQFIETIRLDDLLNTFAGTPVLRPQKYTPFNIPEFDLSKSFFSNPNLYVTSVIHLKIWYIQKADYAHIKNMHKEGKV